MEGYKERRQRNADEAAIYLSYPALRDAAQRSGQKEFGWVHGRFIEMYPGGRATELTALVDMPIHVLLLKESADG